MEDRSQSTYHTHISSKHRLLSLNLKEVWRYRDLIALFTRRNFVVTTSRPFWALPGSC